MATTDRKGELTLVPLSWIVCVGAAVPKDGIEIIIPEFTKKVWISPKHATPSGKKEADEPCFLIPFSCVQFTADSALSNVKRESVDVSFDVGAGAFKGSIKIPVLRSSKHIAAGVELLQYAASDSASASAGPAPKRAKTSGT